MSNPESSVALIQLPTTEQLFHIARIGILTAKNQGRFRSSQHSENAHLFLADEIETVSFNGEQDRQTTQKYIGRVGRKGYRHWSMRIAAPFWVSSDGEDDGFRMTYKFEWTKNKTLIAKRHLHAKADPDIPEFGESLLPVTVDDLMFEADFLHAASEFERVSRADADQLIRDMEAFRILSADIVANNH